MKLKLKGIVVQNLDSYEEEEGRVWDSYEVIVENKVQENTFRDERPNLHNFLRSALKNFGIEVSVRVDEKAVIKRPYTAIEKFQHMAQKNPALVDLKNKFNLDFD